LKSAKHKNTKQNTQNKSTSNSNINWNNSEFDCDNNEKSTWTNFNMTFNQFSIDIIRTSIWDFKNGTYQNNFDCETTKHVFISNCTTNTTLVIETNLNLELYTKHWKQFKFCFSVKKTILIWTTTLMRTTPVVEWSQRNRNQLPILHVRPCTLKSQAFKGLLLFFSRPFNIFWPFVVVEVEVDRKRFSRKKSERQSRDSQAQLQSIKTKIFFPLLLLLSPRFYALSWLAKKLPAFFAFFAFFLQQPFFGQMTIETWSKIFYFSTF
jgi:hypothetical protein